MVWVLFGITFMASVIMILLKMPGSTTKSQFEKDTRLYANHFCQNSTGLTEQSIQSLPEPVKTHLRLSGWINKVGVNYVKAYITSALLKDANDKPPMLVDYTLCSFADEPVRLAYIKTSMFGIPFEGYDSTQGGVGFMKGVFGKVITLFHQRGAEMDKAQLLTYLGECFLIPGAIAGRYITWETIDCTHAKATISYKGVTGSGIFTFGEQGFVQSFQTDQRARIGNDGSVDHPVWSVVYDDFHEIGDILCPAKLKTIWHDSAGELVYFDANYIKFVYNE